MHWHTIANDTIVAGAFAHTVKMAEYLAAEVRKVPYTPLDLRSLCVTAIIHPMQYDM